ncbi:hypothetical protein COW80_01630 [Candidatus Beckwithbacteria bacterium CG22_combo_CG10-13_8_21_14_all_01_47_9]|uniref:Mur ligase central domain-containing protein n=5 Tax=Candidatus Beckwithiibacteriota TaxID=1752726 RepID=A0A2H0E1A6_9BACT|nr:MAG: hypothetical protein AUJ59_03025 [Candidatus Beckwithbacteria bacterium CG1_02_47_37]PIP52342.1 MAG: hypothetical protein COX09_02160 [Candidatus Beckwithbacteria bacterium CG23_combo_of_CG06-09_8_20_14_all_47_9]PIP88205.1 MAG: hypothetical protein COW80_01630 [Candidatus Beckwithbacteria bacterium CG22_combo_CG10-13_8_21_14_all_01_47_9]PJA21518.1 MAG: hypothetical protein COX59_04205 [Candidatus Beckwithbacteria bacterium CG_4_10_14_0_2_um_filter_47_25]PJC66581.1 MAG: hypothetical prot
MVYQIIYWLFLTEAILRCLYFWQLNEYRLDRFREFLRSGKSRRYWLPGFNFLRPRLTLKILLLVLLTVYLSLWFVWWLAYLLVPLTTATSVVLIAPPSDLIKWPVIILAKIKLLIFHCRLLVIGITGSYGKTSTKEILAHVLAVKFKVAKTPGTNNTLIGVALTVLKMPLSAEVLVAEMGAYKIGEIRAICRLVKPKIGILTGINEQHLGLFGSQENIIKAKSELLLALPKTGLAVINGVNPITKKLVIGKAPVRFYRAGKFKTNLPGIHQQLNISAAITVARYLGVKQFDLTHIPRLKTAMIKIKGLNGATIINDSYNSNPDGFLAAVNLAKTIPAKNKILISPGIIELGSASEAVHQRLLAVANHVFDRVFIAEPERQLLSQLEKILTKNHLLLIEGRFSKKFIKKLCL